MLQAISSIDLGMSIKKELDTLMVAIRRCMMKRCIGSAVVSVNFGMSIKEKLDALMMASR